MAYANSRGEQLTTIVGKYLMSLNIDRIYTPDEFIQMS